MSYLFSRYKGKYRCRCPYCLDTNQYPRKLNGTLEDIDVYIDCYNNIRVYYQGKSVLQVYIPSKGRGRNILRSLEENNLIDEIFNIHETDEEVLFDFNVKYDNDILPYLRPKTSGSNRSPFSVKNLPKSKYNIPDEDFSAYKNITDKIPSEDKLAIGHMTISYIKSLTTKRNTYDMIKVDMKKKGLKGKEYIHSIGKWNDFIKYLDKNLEI